MGKEQKIDRRCFLKWSAALGGGLAVSSSLLGCMDRLREEGVVTTEKGFPGFVVRTGCPSHNCGGRCVLKLYVQDEKIVRIETDDRPGDDISDPQLRACIRGRAYRQRQYHPDRLKYPLKRTGERGEDAL